VKALLANLLLLPALALAAPDGAEVYKRKCAGCHGTDGNGGTRKLRPLTDPEVQQKSDAQLFESVARGVSGGDKRMPPFRGKLADAEIRAALEHVRALKR